jgi:salicylate hydroxylase
MSAPIAIVGGGLGGLALAVALVKRGLSVHIYEAAPAFAEIGAGVAFGINSLTAMHLIDPLLLEGYKKHATFNVDRERDSTFITAKWGVDENRAGGHKAGDTLWNLEDVWHPERAQTLGVRTRSCIHRARLLDELVALLPKGITSFGKSLEGAEENPDGTLKLQFADGTTASAIALIGCDGIKSRVRALVCGPHIHATYAGEVAYRAVAPKAAAEAALGTDLALNGHIYCGYGAYIITYPIDHGESVNIVAIPHDPGDAPWTWEHDEWTVPVTKEDVLERFKGWYTPLVDLISRYHLPYKWAMFDLQHDAPYHKGRICLMGDSAHATTPHLGAGAGMAMEDAYILSNLIAAVQDSNDINKAFKAYEAVRRPRTQECIRRSLDAALAWDCLLPDVADDTDALKVLMEESFKWLWHEDLEALLETAKQQL